jgi:hypothetical protein
MSIKRREMCVTCSSLESHTCHLHSADDQRMAVRRDGMNSISPDLN